MSKKLLYFNLALDENDTSLGFAIDWIKTIAKNYDHVDVVTLKKVSNLLGKKDNIKIPGFTQTTPGPKELKSNPALDKLSAALLEFILKKTQNPDDWSYIINYMVEKLGLEFEDEDEDGVEE